MRNYAKEIEKLEVEIKEIDVLINDYVEKRNELYLEKHDLMFNPRLVLEDVVDPLIRMEIINQSKAASNTYHTYERRIVELRQERYSKYTQINLLKESYRKEHTREFYVPMDMIDICEVIHNNGSIKCIKF